MRGMWWVPWSMLMAMAPVALYAIWQVCGRRWRLSVFMLAGVLLLQVLFALALWRGFGDVMAWMALLLVLCWYLMLAGLPALFIGWRYRRQGWPAWLFQSRNMMGSPSMVGVEALHDVPERHGFLLLYLNFQVLSMPFQARMEAAAHLLHAHGRRAHFR